MMQIDKDEIFKYLALIILIVTGIFSLSFYFYHHQDLFYTRAAKEAQEKLLN